MASIIGGTWPKKDLEQSCEHPEAAPFSCNSPPPPYGINEPTAQGPSDASAQGGHQVDIGAPLGHISDWK
jgi:hypothetical protein